MNLHSDELELLAALVERWLLGLYESQRAALDPDLPIPEDLLDGLEEKIALAERVRDKLKGGG